MKDKQEIEQATWAVIAEIANTKAGVSCVKLTEALEAYVFVLGEDISRDLAEATEDIWYIFKEYRQ